MVIDSIEIKTLEKFKLKFIRAIKHQIWSIYLHKTVGLKLRKYILRICNDIYNVVGICTRLSNGMCGVHIASLLAFIFLINILINAFSINLNFMSL